MSGRLESLAFSIWVAGSIAVFVAYSIRSTIKDINRRDEILQAVAARAGLNYVSGGFLLVGRLRGKYAGRNVTLSVSYQYQEFRWPQRSKQKETRLHVALAQPELKSLRLIQVGVGDALGLSRRVRTGDPLFDSCFRLVVRPAAFATDVIGPAHNLWRDWSKLRHFTIRLERGTLLLTRPGFSHSVDEHLMALDIITRLADALEKYQQQALVPARTVRGELS